MNNRRQNLEEERLKAVLKISQAISQTLDLEKVLMMACEMTTRLLNVDRCSIALLFTEKTYEIVKSYKKKDSYRSIDGEKFDLIDYPHIAPLLLKGKTAHISDGKKISLSVRERALLKQLNVKRLLAVPIKAGRKTIGAIVPSRIEESSPFSSSDVSLCQTIANQVGIAITNARLVKTLEEERKELQVSKQQVHLINERLKNLMFSTSVVIYAAKASGDYEATFITDNVRRMVGYSPEKFIKSSNFWIDHIHPEDVQRILQELPDIFKKGFHTYEYRFQCKNGKYLWVRDEMKLIRNDKGQPLEIIGYWTDITGRKKTEEALVESEDRYRRLFEDSPISLWEEDFSRIKELIDSLKSSGVKDFRAYFDNHPKEIAKCAAMVKIIDVNKVTLEFYHAKNIEEFRGGLKSIFREESYIVFKEGLITFTEGKTTFESDAITQTLNGEQNCVYVRWSIPPGYEKTLGRVLISIIDITERKKSEKQIARLTIKVMEAHEEERKKTAARLHDVIIQDLAAIQLDLKMLQLTPPKDINQVISKLKEDEKLLSETLENLSNLTSDLRPRILDELGLFSALRWYADKFRERTNLKVKLRMDEPNVKLSPQVETTLFRIVQESLTNVSKHSKATMVTISLLKKAKDFQIIIQDNGIGIQPDPTYSGTSLGLLRIKENVELIGGKLKIISKKGKGTKLDITFPN